MQNRIKPYKNSLIEDIEFEEIGGKGREFGEFQANKPLPSRIIEWEVPPLSETAKKEARKFRIHPYAVRTGQAIGYVLIIIVSYVGQAIWFVVLVLVFTLASVFRTLFGQRHGFGQGHGQRQDIDWRDVPTGQGRTSRTHVRKSGQGQANNININVHIENH